MKNGQFLVTIPKPLIEKFKIKKGDQIYFLIDEPSEYIKLKKTHQAEPLYSDID
jgi:bifunctional DNA-binding transcriptional regulator/antitoxin component of YhaV-PrlF toxin-antitoxin module